MVFYLLNEIEQHPYTAGECVICSVLNLLVYVIPAIVRAVGAAFFQHVGEKNLCR